MRERPRRHPELLDPLILCQNRPSPRRRKCSRTSTVAAAGMDFSFVTLTVSDKDNLMVPRSMNDIHFEVVGPGEIVATDNGDPTDLTVFASAMARPSMGSPVDLP